MKCLNCGKIINDQSNFCTNCGAKVVRDNRNYLNNDINKEKNKDNEKKYNISILLSVISFIIGPGSVLLCFLLSSDFIFNLVWIPFTIGFFLLIYTFIKYPKNFISYFVLIIYIVFVFLYLVVALFFWFIEYQCSSLG